MDTKHTPLPNYESLFEEEAEKKRDGTGVMLKLLRQNFWRIILSAVLFEIKHCLVWIGPIVTANVINALIDHSPDLTMILIKNGAVVAFIAAIHIPANAIYLGYTDNMLRTMAAGLRSTVIRKLQRLSISYYKEIETGRMQAKFIRDIEAIESIMSTIVKSIVPTILNLIIYITISVNKNPRVALFFVLVAPVCVFISQMFRKPLRKTNREFRHENEEMSSKLADMLSMLPVTKAHGLEEVEISDVELKIRTLRVKALERDHTISIFGASTWLTGQVFTFICLFYSVILSVGGKIAIGDISLFTNYFSSVIGSLDGLINAMPGITAGMEAFRSISEIMLSSDVENDKGKLKLKNVRGQLSFKDVSFRYPGTEDDVVKHLSLDVSPGECIAFVGASGSGKSTVMNMIIGFLMPKSGAFLVDGKPIETIALSEYRHFISVVPQNSILMMGTIRDNITYGMPGISEKRLEEVLELANINEFLPSLPNGIDTVIGENGGKLSGGQKQRICIARALIRDPKILILDEATSSLDNISEYHVQKAISELIKGRTTFIVAHRLSTIRDADRVVVMDGGKCVETGTYDELMEKRGKFFELKTLNAISIAVVAMEG